MEPPIAPLPPEPAPWRSAAIGVVLALATLLTFVPFVPHMPYAGLDASWQIGFSQALAQGIRLGPDLVFTFGPFAAVYTMVYHPATFGPAAAVSTLIALGLAGLLWALARHDLHAAWLALGVVLAAALGLRDVPMFAYPLLLVLLALQQGQPDTRALGAPVLALLAMPIAALPLVKGSQLLLCSLLLGLAVLALLARGRWRDAVAIVAAPLLALPLFWLLGGQQLSDLPLFFTGLREIVAGYTEAMALNGLHVQVLLYTIVAAGLVWLALQHGSGRWFERALLALALALFLFVAFKASFVRHDTHAMVAVGALPVAGLLLGLRRRSRRWAGWTLAAVLVALVIAARYSPQLHLQLLAQLQRFVQAPAHVWGQWQGRHPDNPSRYAVAMQQIRDSHPLPLLAGTADIYSHDQAQLIASGNRWHPRPVLQSYSAYTPVLAQWNREHLLGDDAPDHVLFAIQPLDNRWPALEDGPSWPVLLGRYEPQRLIGPYLHLQKVAGAPVPVPAMQETVVSAEFGERIAVPPNLADAPVWLELDVRPNLLGRLAATLFKPSKLVLTVQLADGSERRFRHVSAMGRSGFLLSPLVEDAREFASLRGAPALWADKRVLALSVDTATPYGLLWQPQIRLRLGALPMTRLPDARLPTELGHTDALRPVADLGPTIQAACEGSIDIVNGQMPAPKQLRAGARLRVEGWVSPNAARGERAAPYLTLTAADGRSWALAARSTPRPDVAKHFGQPSLADSGYTALGDLTQLPPDTGALTLGLAYATERGLVRCPQFAIAVTR